MHRLKDLVEKNATTDNIIAGYCVGDFTKRQSKILGLILLLSRQNLHAAAHIPDYCDFAQTGVSKTKIKEELVKLEEANVLNWDRDKMLFKINENSNEWKVKSNSLFNEKRFEQLLELNEGCNKKTPVGFQ